jgi:hypothetical protein
MTFGYRIPFQNIDKGNIEMFGAFGISRHVNAMTKDFTSLHSGFLFHYLFAILFFMLTAIFLLFSFLTTTSGLLKYLLLAFCYFLLLPKKNLLFD